MPGYCSVKSKMLKTLPCFLALTFLAAYLCSCEKPGDKRPSLSSLAVELGIKFEEASEFKVNSYDVKTRGQKTYRNIDARRDGRVIKIEVAQGFDEKAARAYVAERKYVLHSQFQSAPSPYPGVISSEVTVPKEFAPQVTVVHIDDAPHDLYLLPSTERFTYGAKDLDSIRYRGGVLFARDDAGGSVFRIELFIPLEEYREEDVLLLFGSLHFSSLAEHVESSGVAYSGEVEGSSDSGKLPAPTSGLSGMNLLIIGFEPLGARHVGAYGYPENTTPNLDQFAAGSIIFEEAVSSSSWTLPAFMSWFTSLYPTQHTLTNKYRLATLLDGRDPELSMMPEGIITLAQHLKNNGFRTAGFTGGAAMSGEFGYGRGFDEYFDEPIFGGFDITMPEALKWLRKNRDGRFFLFVQGFDVHGRFPVETGAGERFYKGAYKGSYRGTVEEYWELRDANLDDPEFILPDKDIRFWKANYDAKIRAADERFGAFMEEISGLGVLKDTIIIISSGSGNEYFEHGGLDHGLTLYDELVLVPLMIRVPDSSPGSVAHQVRTIDIMPTALDLLGIDPGDRLSAQMEGVSLAPLMSGEELHLPAFVETDYLAQSFKRGVRTHDSYKFIYSMENGERELYDLGQDPAELTNIVDNEKTMAYKLERILFDHLEELKTNSY